VQVKDHVLLLFASRLEEVDAAYRAVLAPELIRGIVELVPEDWLTTGVWGETPGAEIRRVYSEFLIRRVQHSAVFVEYSINARKAII
jgi:hypothetical protein